MNTNPVYRILGLTQGLFGIFAVLFAACSIHTYTGTGGDFPSYLNLAAAALLLVYGTDRAADNRKAGRSISEAWVLLVPGLILAPFAWWQARHTFEAQAYWMAAAAVVLVFIYFFLIVKPERSKLKFLRETAAALVFAWVLVAIPNRDAEAMPMLAILFAGSCLSNLLVFSKLDYEKDARLGMQGLLHAPWFHADMRALLRAAYVWILFLPPLLAFYVLAPDDLTRNGMYLTGSIYLGMVMVHWILAEVQPDPKRSWLFRFFADAALLGWLAL